MKKSDSRVNIAFSSWSVCACTDASNFCLRSWNTGFKLKSDWDVAKSNACIIINCFAVEASRGWDNGSCRLSKHILLLGLSKYLREDCRLGKSGTLSRCSEADEDDGDELDELHVG